MDIREYVIYSHLAPPRNQQGVLSRPRVSQVILDSINYPLVIVQAGTGYGKSTELVKLTESIQNYYWYSIQETDKDPFLFLVKLFSAFTKGKKKIGETVLDLMQRDQRTNFPELLRIFINEISNNLFEETYLFLDDFHHVLDQPEIEQIITTLIDSRIAFFHLIIATRSIPTYKAITRWRVKGQLKVITRSELAFTKNEIHELFNEKFLNTITEEQADLIFKETEGWAIALQIIWQNIQRGNITIEQVFAQRPITLEALFEYLANDVLSQLPVDLQKFLLTASVLNIIEIEICNLLMENELSEEYINSLLERGLFISSLGKKTYQFQNLFHDFLKAQVKQDKNRAFLLNKKCADFYLSKGRIESAIFHLLEAELFEEAQKEIIRISPSLVEIGRLDTILSWLSHLPQANIEASAELQLIIGEVKRLKSDFEGSLIHFLSAEKKYSETNETIGLSKALRGQAQIYLDTIRPLKAESLLEEALRILEPQEYKQETAALLDQLAENKLNLGHPDQSEALHHEAMLLRNENIPGVSYLEARSSLRTGHLDEGKALLIEQINEEKIDEQTRPQRFHRETSLLLSLICIFQGDWVTAKNNALDGIRIGQQLNSSFVEAVGYIRLGHAYEIQGIVNHQQNLLTKAIDCYQLAIEKVRIFKVTRVQVEPLWALSRSYGYQGKIIEAIKYAKEAMEISSQAGDKWLYNLVLISLGASYLFNGQLKEAQLQFSNALDGFQQVSDVFGVSASLMWTMVAYWLEGDVEEALSTFQKLIPVIVERNYFYLLTKPTYLGLKDEQIIIPILLKAHENKIERSFVEQVLKQMNLDVLDYHPGYRIFVHSLGAFYVWRGDNRIRSMEWQREKARKLFQLLLINQNEWLHRDQIIDRLWPDLTQDAAIRDFKVALNALNKALEPNRPKGTDPFFIIRNENLYKINLQANIWWDAELFTQLAEKSDRESLEEAYSLYKGEFLAENLYDEWTLNKRDQIKQTIILVIEKLSEISFHDCEYEQTIKLSEELLRIEPTWEVAYRNLMLAYAKKENQAQITISYQRMKKILADELGVNPSLISEKLYETLREKQVF